MSPDRCDVTRPWRSMRGVPFGCRTIARNRYRVLKASIANTFLEKSSSLRGSSTTISERLIPIGRRKGCSTQVPFDRGRALGVLWLSRVTRLHREFRFRSDTKGFELSDEHKRTSTNESLLYHIPRQYPPVGGYGVTESPREGERSAVASECRLGLASRGGYRDRVPRSGPWVSRRRPMLPAILVIASLIAGIPLIARSASADGFIQDLGSLDSFSHARAVNELGQIVGESTNDDFRNPRRPTCICKWSQQRGTNRRVEREHVRQRVPPVVVGKRDLDRPWDSGWIHVGTSPRHQRGRPSRRLRFQCDRLCTGAPVVRGPNDGSGGPRGRDQPCVWDRRRGTNRRLERDREERAPRVPLGRWGDDGPRDPPRWVREHG